MNEQRVNTQFEFVTSGQIREEADALVVFVREEELSSPSPGGWIHPQVDEILLGYYAKSIFKARPQETQVIPTFGFAAGNHAVFIGMGKPPYGTEHLRNAGAAAAKEVERLKAGHVQIRLPQDIVNGACGCGPGQAAQAITEGFLLWLHKRLPRKREQERRHAVQTVTWVPESGEPADWEPFRGAWTSGVARGILFAEATGYARDLTNLPGNSLNPQGLAEEAVRLAKQFGLEYAIMDESAAAEQGMGGLLAVGQGSTNPPRMIVLEYRGAPERDEVWGLIGKGITFDSGGLSLKKSDEMENMMLDMGGAAAVLGAMHIIGKERPAVNVVAVIPAAENMPSDRSYRPGDILTTMSGRTVEVIDTDAEGRIVLADAMTTAIKRGATKLVDVATLTYAVMVAFGDHITGLVSNNEALEQQVLEAGRRAGERIWPLPTDDHYLQKLDSDAADLKNFDQSSGDAIVAGLFIGTFAEEKPWVHLDIGGTGWLSEDRGCVRKGATGVMVRTLAELIVSDQ
ncbi:leucyl aminopeptidase [Paenibacillus forsythiae]|uniref:Probable cytosol aminopeptidase n=1 Tax=Paenibacillus forsythiae TaxID=365616 RepID=A0ABU3H4J6_9BACL|nr:leucyl aminopeptidase [Paenibacillus forsythiae]MDT3424967.1 leucyl aminopeptidase [Paenibacillus forsythiae]